MAYANVERQKKDRIVVEYPGTELTWEAMPPRKYQDTEEPSSISRPRYGFPATDYLRMLREISKFDAEKIVEIWIQVMKHVRSQKTPEEETIHLEFEAESPVGREKHQGALEKLEKLGKIRPDTTEDIPFAEE